MIMRRILTSAVLCTAVALPALAANSVYELQQAKSDKIFTTLSESHIDFTPMKSYDKFIISVSGQGGFNHTFESSVPSLDISTIKLPYDGTYSYEIKAVEYLQEVKDTMNNGRSADARGFISKVDVTSGKFTTENFSIIVHDEINEVVSTASKK